MGIRTQPFYTAGSDWRTKHPEFKTFLITEADKNGIPYSTLSTTGLHAYDALSHGIHFTEQLMDIQEIPNESWANNRALRVAVLAVHKFAQVCNKTVLYFLLQSILSSYRIFCVCTNALGVSR